MENFILSSDCQHARNGLCSKCILNQSFSISPAEDRIRRNASSNSIKNIGNLNSRHGSNTSISSQSKESSDVPNFHLSSSLPVTTTQPQNDTIDLNESSYISFADLSKFASVKIQEENNKDVERVVLNAPIVEPDSLLMRLFKSDMFTISIAIQYLHSTPEKSIRKYLGHHLSKFPDSEVDFYIPQLIHMYINENDVASAVHPYIEQRCKKSVHFSLLCLWLLESFASGRSRIKTMTQGEILRQMILNDFQPPKSIELLRKQSELGNGAKTMMNGSLLSPANLETGLTRSESASSSLRLFHLAPSALSNGRSLEDTCKCLRDPMNKTCQCDADRLSNEKEFVSWLTRIGSRLTAYPTKPEKTRQLTNELHLLNMQLPARVWIPLHDNHIVLRIPPTNSCVLNSKDKAPYCIYVEILHCQDVLRVNIPKSLSEAESELNRRLRSHSLVTLSDATQNEPEVNNLMLPDFDDDAHEITVVDDPPEIYPDYSKAPDPAWDTMSLESSSSEPVIRNGILHSSHFGRLKSIVKRRRMKAHPDDPSASTLSEPWEEKRERIRLASPYGRMNGWDLLPVIVKSGDDLAQELLAYQILETFKSVWEEERVSLYLRPYRILVTSPDSGMIEPVVDACSLHQIKRNQYSLMQDEGRTGTPSLLDYFVDMFGPKNSSSYLRAQQNFVESCAGYSLVCYFLQLKDRHNGNILIDSEGHLVHIDFGFILSLSPRNLGFETAYFKLTSEFIDVMGGFDSDMFCYYKTLLLKGLIASRKHWERVMTIVDIMSRASRLPCFRAGSTVAKAMRERFHISYTDKELDNLVNTMVDQSRDSLTTRLYDNFQYYTNGIL